MLTPAGIKMCTFAHAALSVQLISTAACRAVDSNNPASGFNVLCVMLGQQSEQLQLYDRGNLKHSFRFRGLIVSGGNCDSHRPSPQIHAPSGAARPPGTQRLSRRAAAADRAEVPGASEGARGRVAPEVQLAD